ncbi:type IV secretion system DNA-binding domain-containing protein [Acetobacter sp. TBRC 12305]|uniref:Type IV secretion system DNA-binding domain-containing protein n=1 Tax=Acetobacter garciniae TaxID=2817435 RepID=A0A939HQQ4_9PROT|nr:type IV secretion system DNA-binding domain-containing protein [Acetobacter garciniae]MBO1326257.1 type IV secretion system DNA-binding domain-containing protein [Acetobacter garciniae]MBX0346005.1 type IV secretion system DNA-binding domain-containing protein [Acetobacter garciniae]
MAVIRRRIDGPQDFHEQRDGIAYRDTRTLSARLIEALRTEASALPLIAAAGIALAVPAVTTALVPVALAYTGYVLSRPLDLPLRLPGFARRKDYGNPVPDPKRPGVEIPGRAQGDWLLGWDEVTGQQVWVSGNDLTMHGILPGATGSGKTQFIYSLLCSALAQGTGFTIVDGKASNNLPFSLEALQRKWGAAANMRVINFLVANGDRKSHTWSPFASVNAEGMAELLRTLFLPDDKGGGNSAHFRSRADSLIGSMSHVFAWMRDHMGIPVTAATLRVNFSDIQTLIDLVRRQDDSNADRHFAYYSMETRKTVRIPLPAEFPEELLHPVRFYVQETGGYSEAKGTAEGQDKVREQHSYVIGGFAKTFTMMTTTYGHIFNCDIPDVDLQDVIFNRRNLIVLLPSLENDPDTNAAIGKTFITAQRYALSAALGASIEGDYEDLVINRPSAADTPYLMLYDEVNYFATRGIDVMMAQARELNMSIFLSFQEVGSLYATLGRDWATPLLGNPKLKIFENIEDATVTREWVEQTGGTMQVGVLSGYDNSPLVGAYSDQLRADIREVKRISWSDIQALRQGQAIVLFRGKRIYTRLFYAGIKPDGRNRLYSPLRIRNQRATAPAGITTAAPGASRVSEALAAGADLVEDSDFQHPGGVLGEVYNRLAAIISNDTATRDDVSNLFGLPLPEAPFRPFEALFRDLPAPHPLATQSRATLVDRRVNRELYETLVAFEMKMGAPEANARNQIARMLNQTLHAET